MAISGWKKIIGGVADVRRDEISRILPLALAYGLVMASLYVLKPVRNALFLDRLGVAQLPYVLLLVALIGGGAATVFTRFTTKLRLDRLILGTFLLLLICLLGFRVLLPQGWSWSFYLFYVWVNLYGLIATSLMWLLANAVFNARQARRLFGLIGTAGIAGAVIGGAFTGWVVRIVGTENLLLVCVVILGGALALLYFVRSSEVPSRQRQEEEGALAAIGKSRLLILLGSMAGLMAVVAAIVDVQFNEIVDRVFVSKDDKTAFFGQFFAYLSALAFLFQVLFTSRILRSLGVSSALLFLPLSLALGSLAVVFVPGLLAGILVKGGDGGFRHSIHKAATEILFLPVPSQIKQRTKVLLDTTVDNVATGLGALLVLFLTQTLGMEYSSLGIVSLVVILFWVGLIIRTRSAYVDAFRKALERREIGEFTVDIGEASILDSLIANLQSDSERRIVYALDMLVSVSAQRLIEPVQPLLVHPAAEVRQKAVRILQNQEGQVPLAQVEKLLGDDELDVRVEALYCLCLKGEEDRRERLQNGLRSPERRVWTAAAGCIAEYGTEDEKALIDEAYIQSLLSAQDGVNGDNRVQAAKIIGSLNLPQLHPHLRQLSEDPDPLVVEQVIISLGQIRDPAYIPWLLEKIAEKSHRQTARRALVAYDAEVVEILIEVMVDETGDLAIRNNVARILGGIVRQDTVDALLDCIEKIDPQMQYSLVKVLSKLRDNDAKNAEGPQLKFARSRVIALVRAAIESYYEILQLLWLYDGEAENDGTRLLNRALTDKKMQTEKRIFRLLGLLHSPKDMYYAYLGIVSGQQATRGSALEFLENILERELAAWLLPFLDHVSVEAAIEHGHQLFGARFTQRRAGLEYLLGGSDPWLRACAVYSLNGCKKADEIALVEPLCEDAHAVVRQVALKVTGALPG